jgi:hypothetical protein
MTSPSPAADQVSTAQIAHLLAWARSLSDARAAADPTERAAYLAAKTALLARLTDQHSPQLSTEDTL